METAPPVWATLSNIWILWHRRICGSFLRFKWNFLCIESDPIVLHPITGHHWEESASVFFTVSHQSLYMSNKAPKVSLLKIKNPFCRSFCTNIVMSSLPPVCEIYVLNREERSCSLSCWWCSWVQPRMPSATFPSRSVLWPLGPPGPFPPSCFPVGGPQPLLVHGAVLPQLQNLHFLLLDSVRSLLVCFSGLLSHQSLLVNTSSWFCVICILRVHSVPQVINENFIAPSKVHHEVNHLWLASLPLITAKGSIVHSVQSTSLSICPTVLNQFIYGDMMGDNVNNLAQIS